MQMKPLLKNLSYQLAYQILAICLPLLTSPYISRVLGAEGLGTYSYTYSIVNYFTIFAMLGTASYGSRTIAMAKEKNEDLGRCFCSIYCFQLIASMLALALYIFFTAVFLDETICLSVIQGLWIIGCLLDINWFFFGIEEFKVTVIRNTLIKLLTTGAIFVLVKAPGDTWKYALVMAGGNVFSQMALWSFLKKRVHLCMPSFLEVACHIKPNLGLFLPILGVSVYTTMDKTMLGMLSGAAESGFYYNADKVMSMPLTLILAMGTVMMPRMSALRASGDRKKENSLFYRSMEGFMMLAIGMAFGIGAVAADFIPIFFGPGYQQCILLVRVFSVVMVFKTLSNILKNQYLIPHGKERGYTISVFIGAACNFLANCLLIGRLEMGALGAVLGTLTAEVITCICYLAASRREIHIGYILFRMMPYGIGAAGMAGIVGLLSLLFEVSLIKLLWEIVLGAFIYGIGCLTYWKISKRNDRYGGSKNDAI